MFNDLYSFDCQAGKHYQAVLVSYKISAEASCVRNSKFPSVHESLKLHATLLISWIFSCDIQFLSHFPYTEEQPMQCSWRQRAVAV